jgi:hypothetical protein
VTATVRDVNNMPAAGRNVGVYKLRGSQTGNYHAVALGPTDASGQTKIEVEARKIDESTIPPQGDLFIVSVTDDPSRPSAELTVRTPVTSLGVQPKTATISVSGAGGTPTSVTITATVTEFFSTAAIPDIHVQMIVNPVNCSLTRTDGPMDVTNGQGVYTATFTATAAGGPNGALMGNASVEVSLSSFYIPQIVEIIVLP